MGKKVIEISKQKLKELMEIVIQMQIVRQDLSNRKLQLYQELIEQGLTDDEADKAIKELLGYD